MKSCFVSTQAIMYNRNPEIEKNVYFTKDMYEGSDSKKFGAISIKYWNKHVDEILSTNQYLYECIPKNAIVKLYLDIDMATVVLDEVQNKRILSSLLQIVSDQLYLKYQVEIEMEDYIILNSSRLDKMSYHVILSKKIAFKKMEILQTFMLYIYELLREKKEFWYTKGASKSLCILDKSVYTSNQKFRLLNQSKIGKEDYVLTLDDPNIDKRDTFIRLYNGMTGFFIVDSEDIIIKAIKEKSKSEKIITKDRIANNEFSLDGLTLREQKKMSLNQLRRLSEYKQYLYLIPNGYQSRPLFIQVGFALHNAGGTMQDFEDYAKLSPKYKNGRDVRRFHTFDREKLGLSYLKIRAQQACPDFFDVNLARLTKYLNVDLSTMNVYEENSRYLSDKLLTCAEDIVILDAMLGCGKTTKIKEYIAKHKCSRILCISPRITFSYFISSEFGFDIYLEDGIDCTKSNRLVISLESLHRVVGMKYDLIILDEIESTLSTFGGKTMNNKSNMIMKVLINLIETSTKVLAAAAFITEKTIIFMNFFESKSKLYIKNTAIPAEKTTIQVDYDKFHIILRDSILFKGEKNYIVYGSMNALKKDVAYLKSFVCDRYEELKKLVDNDEDKIENYKNTLKNMLIYNRESESVLLKKMTNIKNEWSHTKLVMTTPTITVGNNFDILDDDFTRNGFDTIWIRAFPSCIVADLIQAHYRIRRTKNNRLVFTLPLKKVLDIQKRMNMPFFKILDNMDKIRINKTKSLTQAMYNIFEKMMEESSYESKKHLFDSMIKYTNKIPQLDILNKILKCNFEEELLNKVYYDKFFDFYLKKCNYVHHEDVLSIISSEEVETSKKFIENIKQEIILLKNISTIGEDAYNILLKNIASNTNEEKLQINKYLFSCLFCICIEDTDLTVNSKLLYMKINYYNNVDYIEREEEKTEFILEEEKQQNDEDELQLDQMMTLLDDANNFYFNQYLLPEKKGYFENGHVEAYYYPEKLFNKEQDSKQQSLMKAKIIWDLNDLLQIPFSYIPRQIDVSILLNTSEYLVKNKKEITEQFGFNISNMEKMDLKNILYYIRNVYKIWNDCRFVAISVNGKKNSHYQFTCNNTCTHLGITYLPYRRIDNRGSAITNNVSIGKKREYEDEMRNLANKKQLLLNEIEESKRKEAEESARYKMMADMAAKKQEDLRRQHKILDDECNRIAQKKINDNAGYNKLFPS